MFWGVLVILIVGHGVKLSYNLYVEIHRPGLLSSLVREASFLVGDS